MKKFYCQSRAVPKVLISVCVLLACSLLVTRVSEGQDCNLSFTGPSTTKNTYSNVGDNKVLLTFTMSGDIKGNARAPLASGRPPRRTKDGVTINVSDLPFSSDRVAGTNKWEIKTDGSLIPEGEYIFSLNVWGGVVGCFIYREVTITVGPARIPQRSAPAPPPPPPPPPPKVETPPQKVVVYQCPVGWQRTDTRGHPTPKVFVQAVEVEIDRNNRAGIYTPTAVEIYVDPTESLTDLADWKLTVAAPYNHGRDYLLTAENAVVNEDGIVRIESPEADPFPMRDLTYSGRVLPGFDYRLFTEKGRRVDFAISCYKGTNAMLQHLAALETLRLVRSVDPTHLAWEDILYLRSKWGVPVDAAPAAPRLSNPQRRLTTMWGVLKKQ